MVLVYISPVRWDSIAQRPHFFAKAALEYGFEEILWIEPTASRFPKFKDLVTKLKSVEASSFAKPVNVKVISTNFLPLEPFGKIYDILNYFAKQKVIKSIKKQLVGKRAIFASGKPSRLGINIIESINFEFSVFDVMDDYEHFFDGISAKSISLNLKKMIAKVDACSFSSHALLHKYGSLAKVRHLILNACADDFFQACQINKPENEKERTIFTYGYIGSIASWFDWDCVINLARENPKDKVVLVGPNYSYVPANIPENIIMKPAVKHDEIPMILSTFDYGIIPFRVNSLTECVDPVKYYEYCACRLKVLTTPFGEMKRRLSNGNVYSFTNYKNNHPLNFEKIYTWSERFAPLFLYINENTKNNYLNS